MVVKSKEISNFQFGLSSRDTPTAPNLFKMGTRESLIAFWYHTPRFLGHGEKAMVSLTKLDKRQIYWLIRLLPLWLAAKVTMENLGYVCPCQTCAKIIFFDAAPFIPSLIPSKSDLSSCKSKFKKNSIILYTTPEADINGCIVRCKRLALKI